MTEAAAPQLTEKEFYALAKQVFDRIEAQFDDVDPDEVECETGNDQLVLTLAGGARWVLSRQPPVRQLWLAVASRGRAFHFDYDAATGTWQDDKGAEPDDLLTFLARMLKEETGLELHF